MKTRLCPLAALALLSLLLPASAGQIDRVSLSSTGTEANGESLFPDVSADGRCVVFLSAATNLVPDDTNGFWDIFLRDRVAATTVRVDVGPNGEEADAGAWGASITPDGRFVVFDSDSTNLVPDDTNDSCDVFLLDREAGALELISLTSAGQQAHGCSHSAAVSADGRYVAFRSYAADLVPDDTNDVGDVFVRDRQAKTTERVSVSTSGEQADDLSDDWDFLATISADGRFVAFGCWAKNLAPGVTVSSLQIYLRDLVAKTTECITLNAEGAPANDICYRPVISADGRCVAFISDADNLVPGDTNAREDIFLRDRVAGTIERVSLTDSGQQLVTWAGAGYPAISADGRYITFSSNSPDLYTDERTYYTNSFLRDRIAARTQVLTRTFDGWLPDMDSDYLRLSPDSRFVVFTSYADDLIPDDTNDVGDIFLRDRLSFPDVPLTHWAYYDINACLNGGIVTGYPNGDYRPAETVTRDQMAVYISRALADGDANIPTGPANPSFPDVPTDHWAYKCIEYAKASTIVQGYWNGYQPDRTVDRAQMAVYIARSIVEPTGEAGLEDYVPPTTPHFPDLPTDHWAYKHIEYCFEEGVVQGLPSGYYRPAWPVDRAQMAVYMNRAFALPM